MRKKLIKVFQIYKLDKNDSVYPKFRWSVQLFLPVGDGYLMFKNKLSLDNFLRKEANKTYPV